MRISIREQDPGFTPDAKTARVLVDGINVPEFITADEESGFVRVGSEILRGKVEITLPSAASEQVAVAPSYYRRDKAR